MIIWGRVQMSCGQKGGEKEMEDLASHRANLRNSPDRRIDFSLRLEIRFLGTSVHAFAKYRNQ